MHLQQRNSGTAGDFGDFASPAPHGDIYIHGQFGTSEGHRSPEFDPVVHGGLVISSGMEAMEA
jgi:hypothetical protein